MGIWAGIKHALNSSLGTENFMPLDEIMKDCASKVIDSCEAKAPVSAKHFSVTAENVTSLTTVVSASGKGYVDFNHAAKNTNNKTKVVVDGVTLINSVALIDLPSSLNESADANGYYNARMQIRFNKSISIQINRAQTGASNTGKATGFIFFEE